MTSSTRIAAAACAFLAFLGGCRAPEGEPTAPPGASSASAPAHPAAAESTSAADAHAAIAAEGGSHAESQAPAARNRDPHGDPDVGRYVARLASPERVAELRVDEVVAKLAIAPGSVVGDLGCGPGVFAIPLARAAKPGFVLASDLEPGQLDALRAALLEQDVRNVVPVLSSASDAHFPAGRLDLVFVGDTYHHLRDRVAYFRRLRDVFAPGGRLAILEYKPGDLPVGPAADHKLPAGVREAELAEAGYALVERHATHAYHDFEIWRVAAPERK